jgi:competence protein ComEC
MAVKICIIDYGYSKFYKILSCIKEKLILVYDRILDNREFGVLIAMLLGEKYLINEEIRELYQKNGISHILSISGLHISLIAMYVFIFLKKLKIPVTPAALLSILFIYSYGAFTNFSISTNRSVVMMTLLFFAKVIGKTYDMLSAISLSAFLILLNSPLQIFNTGFLLSFGAVMGIGIVFPCLQALFPTKNRIFNSLLISISAQILIVPVILVFYYQFPLYSVIINLFLLPALSVLLITAVIAGIAGVIYLPAGIFCIGGVNYILKFYEWVCIWGCKIPGNLITTGKPDKICILLYFILLGIFVWGVKCYSRKEFIILPAVSLLMLLPQGTDGLTITMLDVGQGESICMQAENKTYLIDCGSTDIKNVGIYRLTPFLLSNGVDKIDYAMFTHSDYDHISGIREIIKKGRIKISHLVLPKIKVKDEVYSEFEALTGEKKIMLQYIKAGDFIQDGRLRIICLHPLAEHQLLSANDNSMVLSVSYGDFDMLLTGDIEADGEKQLIEQLQNKSGRTEYVYKPVSDYDILKVSHHGSKSSTSEAFLQIVRPEAALISCGKNNSYGHPHKELLERLLRIGCHVRITYETGAVTIKTDGNKLKISNFIRESDLE